MPSGLADGPPGRWSSWQMKEEDVRRKEAHEKSCKSPHPVSGQAGIRAGRSSGHIYFPLEIISIVRYRPLEISIQK